MDAPDQSILLLTLKREGREGEQEKRERLRQHTHITFDSKTRLGQHGRQQQGRGVGWGAAGAWGRGMGLCSRGFLPCSYRIRRAHDTGPKYPPPNPKQRGQRRRTGEKRKVVLLSIILTQKKTAVNMGKHGQQGRGGGGEEETPVTIRGSSSNA